MIPVTVLHADGRTSELRIEPKLEEYQRLVGGYIEQVFGLATGLPDRKVLLVNEEGRLRGLPQNQHELGLALDLVGDVVLVDEGDFR